MLKTSKIPEIPIIAETDDYLVINKPAGIMVHADGRSNDPTIVDWINEKYPTIAQLHVGEKAILHKGTPSEEEIDRPGIVHRLDRDTSGLLLIAKTRDAHSYFKRAFGEREMHKEYIAYLYGHVKSLKNGALLIQPDGSTKQEPDLVVNRPIGRSKGDFRQYSAQRGSIGVSRDAITEVFILGKGYDRDLYNMQGKQQERVAAKDAARTTFVRLVPHTGRTHQIRVHAKAINHPVVGDTTYAGRRKAILGFKRLALHAHKLNFIDMNGKKVSYEAVLPNDFVQAASHLVVEE